MCKIVFLKVLFLCLLMSGCAKIGEKSDIVGKPNNNLLQVTNPEPQVSRLEASSEKNFYIASSEKVPDEQVNTIDALTSDKSELAKRNALERNPNIPNVRHDNLVPQLRGEEPDQQNHEDEEKQKTVGPIGQLTEEKQTTISGNTKNATKLATNGSFALSNKQKQTPNNDTVLNDMQKNDSETEQNPVYSNDLHETKLNQPDNYAEKKNKTKSLSERVRNIIEPLKKHSTGLIFITVIILLIVINFIAVRQTYRGRAIFFGSGGDVFLFCLPLIIMALAGIWLWIEDKSSNTDAGHISVQGMLIVGALIFLLIYNIIRPLFENRHRSFIVILCVIISRLTLGYLLVFGIVLAALSSHTLQRADESNLAYEMRRRNSMLRGAAILGGLGFILASLIRQPYMDVEDYEDELNYDEIDDDNSKQYWDNPPNCYSECEEPDHQTNYEVLGVSPTATEEEIKHAYREIAKQYHPDKTAHLGKELQELAHKKMQQINDAYESLMNNREQVNERN